MYVKHLAADVKIHRARQVLGEVAHLHDDYLASDAFRLVAAAVPDGTSAWRLRLDREPPAELSQLVATALCTARSALDELAVSLVIAGRRTPWHTRFPIAPSAHAFADVQDQCLRRANQTAKDAVRAVTPWKGADDRLWELEQLGSEGSWRPTVRLGQLVARSSMRVPSALRVLQTTAPHRGTRFPLLDDGDLVRGQPLVESLDLLITHAADVIDRVVRAAERH